MKHLSRDRITMFFGAANLDRATTMPLYPRVKLLALMVNLLSRVAI